MPESCPTPKCQSRYVKVSYLLILIGAAIHVFEGVFAQAGFATMSAALYANLFVFLGLLMALLGYSVFRTCMDEKHIRRLKYILVSFLAVFVVYGGLAYFAGGAAS